MMEYRVQQLLKNLTDTQLTPIQSYVSEQQATSFRNDFFKANPDLEEYETLVDAVAAKLQNSGYKGATRAEVMKKFADESRIIVKQLLAKGGAPNGAAPAKTGGAVPQQRKMSTLTGGGQPTGGRAAAAPKGPSGIEVFE